jgi:hypothetical protein
VCALSVECKQWPLVLRIDDFVNRPDRTRGDTRAAVDAYIRIDVVALAVRMEALHRAMLDTVGKEAERQWSVTTCGISSLPYRSAERLHHGRRPLAGRRETQKHQIPSTSTRLSE